ncbi:MAG: CopG family transcriptional regulator [Gammaproteobacteria bacterium HGW-Gammaproteobacteria-8]|nr:MAG: CopG family transcriptional regulator [Gammaproteobacteria bacterium HGW-Gammaproteobacteria-8]
MIRTQVYLTEQQMRALKRLAVLSGRRQSELIREAVDLLTREREASDWRRSMAAAAGLWKGRDDLPDLSRLRSEFDRES